jgi:hypothetical protein
MDGITEKLTPAMRQFQQFKQKYPGYIQFIPIVLNNSAFNGLFDVAHGDSGPNNY